MTTALVTGGCGFIGSHLAAALVARGHRVRVLDDLSSGRSDYLPGGVELLEADVADPVMIAEAMRGVDVCFHLAAVASVEKATRDWLGTHRTNLSGTIAVLDAARRARQDGAPLPVVYASSAAVYGDAADLPITEAAVPAPISAYGADKYGSELHARVGGRSHGVPTAGLRFFNVFGPRQDPRSHYSGVISIFCDRISRGLPVTIYGDGRQTRDFVYVGDVVAALLGAWERATTDAPVFNVCSGTSVEIIDLAGAIAELCGRSLVTESGPARSSEIRHSLGSRRLAEAALLLSPPTPVREGLAQTLAWMQAERLAAEARSNDAQE
jgi:UDP-glucose 4-epimerase